MENKKTIAVLGSTGSVGRQALDVARAHGFGVDALCAGKNISLLEKQIREFSPAYCALFDENAASDLAVRVADTKTKILSGKDGIAEMIHESKASAVVNSILGLAGLMPTLEVIKSKKRLAIANKESLVAAGKIVKETLRVCGGEMIPVDSEHSAIFQCLKAGEKEQVKKIILTASGGPFFGCDKARIEKVTLADALNHPTWDMGVKITVDCATLMNKGLEVIEAVRLFDVTPSQIEVVVHRESIIHSAVEYIDNAVIAQMSVPDMRECVQYALTYPARQNACIEELNLFSVGKLTFEKPDTKTFTLLPLAFYAIEQDGILPAVLSAANEEAVRMFALGKIEFCDISTLVERVVRDTKNIANPSLEQIFEADKAARELTARFSCAR